MFQIERILTSGIGRERSWQRYLFDTVLATIGALCITGVIYFFHLYQHIPNITLVYLLLVLALASTRGLYAAIVAGVVAFFSFDFFLVPPLYKFTIAHTEEWLALIVFLATAIITGQLASALRQRATQANRQARETRILYELVQATNSDEDLGHQLHIIAKSIVDVFSTLGVRECAILLPDKQGKLILRVGENKWLSADEDAMASLVMTRGQTVELHDVPFAPQVSYIHSPRAVVRSTDAPQKVRRYVRMIPLMMSQKVVGVARLLIEDDPHTFAIGKNLGVEREGADANMPFFWTFLDQAVAVIERARLRSESMQIELLQRTDALRAALLSSVSHDLRTPLSSIKAAATSLLQEDVTWDEEARRSFALAIEHETDRLNRLVENLLDMSRIEGGALKPEKEWYPLEELIHDVLGHMQPLVQDRVVDLDVADNLPPVELDYLQIDQVLTNLLENAVRYTPASSPISISAHVKDSELLICVADRGPGIPLEEREHVFDKFYRVLGPQRVSSHTTGSGLGLAVSKGLVEAHGGHIWVENREGGGSKFCFTLPVRETKTEEIER